MSRSLFPFGSSDSTVSTVVCCVLKHTKILIFVYVTVINCMNQSVC